MCTTLRPSATPELLYYYKVHSNRYFTSFVKTVYCPWSDAYNTHGYSLISKVDFLSRWQNMCIISNKTQFQNKKPFKNLSKY